MEAKQAKRFQILSGVTILSLLVSTTQLSFAIEEPQIKDPNAAPGELVIKPPQEGTYTKEEIIVQLENPDEQSLDKHFSVRHITNTLHPEIQKLDDDGSYLLKFDSEDKAKKALEEYDNNTYTDAHPNLIYTADQLQQSTTGEVTTNDPLLGSQYNLTQIGARRAWNRSQGAGVTVAVIDSGIDTDHPDLSGNLWVNSDESPGNGIDDDGNGYVDDRYGWNFVESNNNINPIPVIGQPNVGIHHGTHVAGVVGAIANNATGIAGAAPQIKVMGLKILNNEGIGSTASLISAINYARINGAKVINLSLTASSVDPSLDAPIRAAHDAGIVIAAATGNLGKNLTNGPISPTANDAGVNAVLGIASVSSGDYPSSFSNYGSGTDLTAPGEAIQSTLYHDGGTYSQYYGAISGTSQAAPQVSAAAAILKAMNPGWSAAKISNQILAFTDDIHAGTQYGQGRLNIFKAISNNQAPEHLAIIKQHSSGDMDNYVYDAPIGQHYANLTGYDYWNVTAGNNIEHMTGCDYDGDGNKEIAVIKNEHGDRNFYVFGVPQGAEQMSILAADYWNIPSGNEHIIDMAGGDFDGDGRCDIAVMVNEGGDYNLHTYHVPLGTGFGEEFSTDLWEAPSGDNAVQMTAGDANGDGIDELFVLKNQGGDYNLFSYNLPIGIGQSSLVGWDYWEIPSGNGSTVDLASLDVDGNGSDEIAVLRNDGGDYNIYVYEAPVGEEHSPLVGWDFWNIPDGNNGRAIAGVK